MAQTHTHTPERWVRTQGTCVTVRYTRAHPPPDNAAHHTSASIHLSFRYQRYLEAVLEVADEYQDIGELLSRHATLQATHRDLLDHMTSCNASAEAMRSELAAYTKQRADQLLLLNNRLAQLKQQLESYEQDAALSEAAKDGTLHVASQRTLMYGQIVLAADNLFSQCQQHSHIAHAPEAGTMQQLEVIGNYISDLVAVCAQKQQQQACSGLNAAAAEAATLAEVSKPA